MIVTRGLGSNRLITQGYGSYGIYIFIITRDYIRQQIIDDIIATLRTIKVSNGYQTNAGNSITRKYLSPSLIDRTPHLSVCDGTENLLPEVDRVVEATFSMLIYGVVDDRYDPSKAANKVIGDIKDALLTDQERNDLANTTMVKFTDSDEGKLVSPDRSFFTLSVEVQYSHLRTTP